MELVGARTGLGGNHRGDGLAQLGVEVLRGDLGLSHRIHCRIDDDDAQNRILVVGAVQLEGGSAEGLAVNLNLFGTLGIFIGRVGPAQNLGARQQQLQVGKVLVANREAGNLLLVENGGDVGAVGLQLRLRFGVYFDGFIAAADLHDGVNAGRRVGLDLNALGLEGLEALERDLEVVNVGDKVGNAIVARAVGGGSNDGALGLVRYRDRGACDGRPGRIGHSAENRSVDRLRTGRHIEQQTHADKKRQHECCT